MHGQPVADPKRGVKPDAHEWCMPLTSAADLRSACSNGHTAGLILLGPKADEDAQSDAASELLRPARAWTSMHTERTLRSGARQGHLLRSDSGTEKSRKKSRRFDGLSRTDSMCCYKLLDPSPPLVQGPMTGVSLSLRHLFAAQCAFLADVAWAAQGSVTSI